MVIKKIDGTSIIEVVMAITLISLAIGMSTLVVVRVLSLTNKYENLSKQIEIKAFLFQGMRNSIDYEKIENVKVDFILTDTCRILKFSNSSDVNLWDQEWPNLGN